MGRTVRRVPKDWQHPTNERGHHIALFDGFSAMHAEWTEGKRQWDAGFVQDYGNYPTVAWKPKDGTESATFEKWHGKEPVAEDYMPEWPDSERTHFQMYETTSEGTPISPVMASPEELARWLADSNASAFAHQGASYESWLRVCNGGYAPSAVFTTATGLTSGVEGVSALESGS